MIQFLLLFFIIATLFYIIIPIFKGIFMFILLSLSFIFILSLIKYFIESQKDKKAKRVLNILTTKEVFEGLQKEEKRHIARYIDEMLNNERGSNHTLTDDLKYIALGYTTSTLGFDRIVRYGFGYVILRDFLKGLQKGKNKNGKK